MQRSVKQYKVGVVTKNEELGEEYDRKQVHEKYRPDADSEKEAIRKTKERYPQGNWELVRIESITKIFE